MLQLAGYHLHQLHRRYIRAAGNWFDWSLILLTAILLWRTLYYDKPKNHPSYCALLGSVFFFKFIRLLISIQRVRAIGMHILPMLATMREIWSFTIILVFILLAAVFFFYSM